MLASLLGYLGLVQGDADPVAGVGLCIVSINDDGFLFLHSGKDYGQGLR